MRTSQHEASQGVRERLLQAAFEVFAELGFKNTTVRDICCRADVNVASVNYYFGSKQALYEAVCKYSCGASDDAPPTFAIDRSAAPAEKLFSFIHSFLQAILQRGVPSLQGKIMAREMMEPTSAINIIVQEVIRPRHEQLCEIVREFLGADADDGAVRQCCFSIVGQCLYFRFARTVAVALHPKLVFDETTVMDLARHITRFSLLALEGLSREE